MRADVPSQFLQRTDGSLARRPGMCSTRTRLPSSSSRRAGRSISCSTRSWTAGQRRALEVWCDRGLAGPSTWYTGCRSVQERPNRPNCADSKTHWTHRTDWTLSKCCHGASARSVIAQPCSGRSRAASARHVVIPWGGGGVSVIPLARSGVQRSGGQRAAKMHAMRPSGRAALGASNPAQPSRQSASPMSW
jgi:hypothetical protein